MKEKIMILMAAVIILIIGIISINLYTSNKTEGNDKTSVYQNESNADYNDLDTQIPPPAGVYCIKMGYKTRHTEQRGFCIFPDGSECGVWSFYAGLCGQEWSYCKVNGYDLISGDVASGRCKYASNPICSVCINKTSRVESTIDDLMNLTKNMGGSVPGSTISA